MSEPKEYEESITDQDNNSDSEESDEEMDSDQNCDFWRELIELTINDICTRYVEGGHNGVVPYLKNVDQILEDKHLIKIMSALRKNMDTIKRIFDAADDDKVYDAIKDKKEKIMGKMGDDEKYEETAGKMAWKKYKEMVKEKIEKNLDLFDIVIPKNDDTSDSASDNVSSTSDNSNNDSDE